MKNLMSSIGAFGFFVSCAAQSLPHTGAQYVANEMDHSGGSIITWSNYALVCKAEGSRLFCQDITTKDSWSLELSSPIIQVQGGAGYVCALDVNGSLWCAHDTISSGLVNVKHGGRKYSMMSAKHGHVCALEGSGKRHVDCWRVSINIEGVSFDYYRGYDVVFACDMISTNVDLYIIGCDKSIWSADMVRRSHDAINVLVPKLNRELIVGGFDSACGVSEQGRVLCWGAAHGGGRGIAMAEDRSVPLHVANIVEGPIDVANLVEASNSFCAWQNRGDAWCWGLRDRYRIVSVHGEVLLEHEYEEFQGGTEVMKIDGEVIAVETDGRSIEFVVASPVFAIEE